MIHVLTTPGCDGVVIQCLLEYDGDLRAAMQTWLEEKIGKMPVDPESVDNDSVISVTVTNEQRAQYQKCLKIWQKKLGKLKLSEFVTWLPGAKIVDYCESVIWKLKPITEGDGCQAEAYLD